MALQASQTLEREDFHSFQVDDRPRPCRALHLIEEVDGEVAFVTIPAEQVPVFFAERFAALGQKIVEFSYGDMWHTGC